MSNSSSTFAKLLAKLTPFHKLLLLPSRNYVRIVFYHLIGDEPRAYYLPVKTDAVTFRNQIRYFKRRFEIVSLKEAARRAQCGESLRWTMAITTDDGLSENYSVLAPVLMEEGVTATFFLIGSCIDNRDLMWRNKLFYVQNAAGMEKSFVIMGRLADEHRLDKPARKEDLLAWSARAWPMSEKIRISDECWKIAELEPLSDWLAEHRPYMSTRQIEELTAAGFDIGAHTMTHPDCSKLELPELEAELVGSIDYLSQKFGREIDLFAYPFGKRASQQYESAIIDKYPGRIQALLGTDNSLDHARNPLRWERDTMERKYEEGIARFLFAPLRKKWLKRIKNS